LRRGRWKASPLIDALLLASTRVGTFSGTRALTAASGFFFENGARLFLVTSRHVLVNAATEHFPDRVEIVLHTDAVDLTRTAVLSMLLYQDGKSLWRQAKDSGGEIDVAALEIDRAALPKHAVFRSLGMHHLPPSLEEIGIGTPLLIVGFPLGFYDTLHNLPVVRQAAVASAFGVRFQGEGFFLTDARSHRGASGAPVVMADTSGKLDPGWRLLGIHSGGFDMKTREQGVDDTLGLNCAWYADILRTLTA
jgi:S1-C subfamily serine protease